MIRFLTGLLLSAAILAAQAQFAAGQSRRALVIGADDYRNVEKLHKAVGDASTMKVALERLGFEVDLLVNPDRAAFNAGIFAFTQKLKSGDIALVHYSGHGVALDGENYLLPVDAPRPDRTDKEGLKHEAFALMPLIERIRSTGSTVLIAIVDACRDNPYAQSGTRSIGRSGGLTEPQRKPARGQGGFFIMFSAGFGQTAADRLDDNDREQTSVYTRTLLRKIVVEGKAITDLAREVREDVEALAATVRHEQRPAYYDELSGPNFYFAPPRGVALAPSQPSSVQSPASTPPPLSSQQAAIPLTTQPSFDCRSDISSVESAICADAGLAARDRILSESYYRLTDRVSQAERIALRDQQRDWIRQRNACGPDNACIAQLYDRRIAELQGSVAPVAALTSPPPQRSVTPNVQPSFACTGALSNVERMICADPALAERDNLLTNLYKQARSRRGVAESQRAWIKLRNACIDAACVAKAYDTRIGELRAAVR